MFENEARNVLEKAIAIFEEANVDYGDIRFDRSQSTNIFKNTTEEKVSSGLPKDSI